MGKEEGGSSRPPVAHELLRRAVIGAPTCCRAAERRSQVKLLPFLFLLVVPLLKAFLSESSEGSVCGSAPRSAFYVLCYLCHALPGMQGSLGASAGGSGQRGSSRVREGARGSSTALPRHSRSPLPSSIPTRFAP